MANNRESLGKSKEIKNDEFYTLLEDIENEIGQYDFSEFKNKIVYCNADDPTWSNFFVFFTKWGKKLGLKEVHFTNYSNKERYFQPSLINIINGIEESIKDDKSNTAHHWTYYPGDGKTVKRSLTGNGDFRSKECIEILKKSDIIITNPPFSLFREFTDLVLQNNKKLLVIGPQNALSYKEIFKLIKSNSIWIGNNYHLSGFLLPSGKKISKNDNKARSCCWFTNLEVLQRNKKLVLHKQDLKKYRKYDNYNGIEVPETKLIPDNFDGEMGVPITFLQKYNPNQFKIVGLGTTREVFKPNKEYASLIQVNKDGSNKKVGPTKLGLTIRLEKPPDNEIYYIEKETSKILVAPYARIIIKKRQ
jgi:hypothetical protein